MSNQLCDYGCGQEAKYQFKNGKWCCCESNNSCPEIKMKISESLKQNKNKNSWNKGLTKKDDERILKHSELMKKLHNDPNSIYNSREYKNNHLKIMNRPETKKKISKSKFGKPSSKKGIKLKNEQIEKMKMIFLLTIEKINIKYPFFSKIEEMRYNPVKPDEKEIQVHCKNNKCQNSKEKGGWFTPSKSQIKERIRHLENENGNGGSYIYCSQKCKDECILYNLHSDPNKETEKPYTQEEYNIWKQVILEQDNYECQYCQSKKELHCHHIHPVKTHPHLALDPTNGIVLCKKCHYEIGHKDECSTGNLASKECN